MEKIKIEEKGEKNPFPSEIREEKGENEIHQCLLKSETALSPNRALAFLLIKSLLLKNMWV